MKKKSEDQSEHQAFLKAAPSFWNEWRARNPGIKPALRHADLAGTFLGKLDLSRADLTGADLTGASLRYADLRNANLTGANLSKADLNHSNLRGVTLSNANLTDCDLANTNLTWADLENANLSGADLFFTALDHTNLRGANFTNAIIGGTTFGDNDLRDAKGLSKVRHWGPCSIGVDTLDKSKGSVPDSFLRGIGVPESLVKSLKSIKIEPDYHSCFVSYASKDQVFVGRLYADLQGKGVRCWFAPEDLKIGEKMRSSIEDSVQKHDRLLLVLSRHSVASPWVETEVETAFEQERIHNRVILLPIRIDNTVMKLGTGWAADIRRTRNIGDFTRWKDVETYERAFNLLMRDLMVTTA